MFLSFLTHVRPRGNHPHKLALVFLGVQFSPSLVSFFYFYLFHSPHSVVILSSENARSLVVSYTALGRGQSYIGFLANSRRFLHPLSASPRFLAHSLSSISHPTSSCLTAITRRAREARTSCSDLNFIVRGSCLGRDAQAWNTNLYVQRVHMIGDTRSFH